MLNDQELSEHMADLRYEEYLENKYLKAQRDRIPGVDWLDLWLEFLQFRNQRRANVIERNQTAIKIQIRLRDKGWALEGSRDDIPEERKPLLGDRRRPDREGRKDNKILRGTTCPPYK